MIILNLGCGTKTSTDPSVVNIDWSVTLRLRRNPVLRAIAPLLLTGPRLERFNALGSNIVVHDLSKGIPYTDASVDAVFHSHVIEHLDRDVAIGFMNEVRRVLKPGGFHRILAPDFEQFCRRYLDHIEVAMHDAAERKVHEQYLGFVIEQCVRAEASGTSQQGPVRRRIENFVLGDARKRGETHRWMYDRLTLCDLLETLGYRDVHAMECGVSNIPRWREIGLEVDREGRPHKAFSLYVEARKGQITA